MNYRILSLLTALILYLVLMPSSLAVQDKNLWHDWIVFNPRSTKTIDHSNWQKFLDSYVKTTKRGINLVNYTRAKKSGLKQLNTYINAMQKINIDNYNRQEQFAYWVNLYNALVTRIVVKYYPIHSIQNINITPGLFARGPWGSKLVKVQGQDLSLNDIANRILRPIWHDPRIHYALSTSAVSCPNLNKQAYTGANKDKLLNSAATHYINNPRGVRFVKNRLYVSRIYEWYKYDFGEGDTDVIRHLKIYAKPALVRKLSQVKKFSGSSYNWNLNAYHRVRKN